MGPASVRMTVEWLVPLGETRPITMALHADEMVVMDAGRVVHQGACSDAATHRALEEVFGRRLAVHSLAGQWVALPN